MASSAPALDRGIDILEWLQNKDGASLEDLSTNLGIPKSSALRFLETLQKRGIVSRDPLHKTYQCRMVLMPLYESGQEQEFLIHHAIESLCGLSNRTVEFYRPETSGARLVDRMDPPKQEVKIVAGIGFYRDWFPELEAVSTISQAYAPVSRITSRILFYPGVDGPRTNLSPDAAAQRVKDAHHAGHVMDTYFNNFGVRRMACPVLRENKLVGILALAEHFVPSRKPSWNQCLPLLKAKAKSVFKTTTA